MIITRRGFLKILAAPAIVSAANIMRIDPKLIGPPKLAVGGIVSFLDPPLFMGEHYSTGTNYSHVSAWIKESGGEWKHHTWRREVPARDVIGNLGTINIYDVRVWSA